MNGKPSRAERRGLNVNHWARLALLASWAVIGGCGGGNGGGNEPSVPVEYPVVLGQPGSGDPENYVPLAVGNSWHFGGTASGEFGTVVDNRVAIVGTQVVNGVSALVLRESSPAGNGTPLQESIVKDANGVGVLAGDPTDDALTRSLIPYWELRFPLTAGSRFVQLDRTRLDLGQDLDGDGRNEAVAIKSELSVVGTESVTVPVGSFSNALRVERTMALSITLSRNGAVIPATQTGSAWLVRDLGWVRRTTSLTIQGTTSTLDERLDAYQVGGKSSQVASAPVIAGSIGAGGSASWVWPTQPASRYTATLAGLTGNADLTLPGSATCAVGTSQLTGNAAESCTFVAGAGTQTVEVTGVESARYLLWFASAPIVAAPVNETVGLGLGVPTPGQVASRGASRYFVIGLTPGRYTVSVGGASDAVALHVYAYDPWTFELDCTLRSPGSRDCTLDSFGSVFFEVWSGPLNRAGASYVVLVAPAP